MSDDDQSLDTTRTFYLPNFPQPAPRQPKRGELLFEFVRASDRAPISCELPRRVRLGGAVPRTRRPVRQPEDAFVTRTLAVQWAEEERRAMTR